jgi:drug/metabolite transporter (DMT)-like permease
LSAASPPTGSKASPDALGGVLVALASVQFGIVVILGKIVTDGGLPTISFLALRFGLAAVMIGAALAAFRQPLRAAKGEGWRLAVLGVAGYALEASLFFAAVRRGGPGAVTLLFFTYPVWVAVFAALTGKGLPGRLVGMALVGAVAGAALVAARKLPTSDPHREAKFNAALLTCIRIPQTIGATALAILGLCEKIADQVNPHLLSDLEDAIARLQKNSSMEVTGTLTVQVRRALHLP